MEKERKKEIGEKEVREGMGRVLLDPTLGADGLSAGKAAQPPSPVCQEEKD